MKVKAHFEIKELMATETTETETKVDTILRFFDNGNIGIGL